VRLRPHHQYEKPVPAMRRCPLQRISWDLLVMLVDIHPPEMSSERTFNGIIPGCAPWATILWLPGFSHYCQMERVVFLVAHWYQKCSPACFSCASTPSIPQSRLIGLPSPLFFVLSCVKRGHATPPDDLRVNISVIDLILIGVLPCHPDMREMRTQQKSSENDTTACR